MLWLLYFCMDCLVNSNIYRAENFNPYPNPCWQYDVTLLLEYILLLIYNNGWIMWVESLPDAV